ncbi:hypothetical protein [Chryseobacterium balustinum]|uniref:Uncharacterized protein n=1 Tax=Chryseobacterium balustinum TaxID=246 RepID=A0AAX2IKX9_9FLAO|nr:hypothetical protein [Chryseobacterium balustinum]AZB30719.1 hypothetical protein EB354_16505 [Chryseobacterium balustinum]SKB98596.1 hypothetical protein SAMN05421800_11848 [Chryseobacterium balustinum]SQA88849.1 Uncharacterised protein [Chryseobacterium balustinum]
MKFRLLLLIVLVSQICFSQIEKIDAHKVANINYVIDLFKQKNIEDISQNVNYPLRREYPIPEIKNREQFKQRFTEVFDEVLINNIANSKLKQWSEMGWRGIMLDNGTIWIDSDEGKIIAVNYQSDFEKKLKENLINKEKENVHVSLKTFESPTYKIKTKNYLIRIDELENKKYRYASWKISKKESSKPDLILNNGELDFQGSGGNHVIIFTNGNYIYKVYRNIIGEESTPDITLEIEENGKIILHQNGILIRE